MDSAGLQYFAPPPRKWEVNSNLTWRLHFWDGAAAPLWLRYAGRYAMRPADWVASSR